MTEYYLIFEALRRWPLEWYENFRSGIGARAGLDGVRTFLPIKGRLLTACFPIDITKGHLEYTPLGVVRLYLGPRHHRTKTGSLQSPISLLIKGLQTFF